MQTSFHFTTAMWGVLFTCSTPKHSGIQLWRTQLSQWYYLSHLLESCNRVWSIWKHRLRWKLLSSDHGIPLCLENSIICLCVTNDSNSPFTIETVGNIPRQNCSWLFRKIWSHRTWVHRFIEKNLAWTSSEWFQFIHHWAPWPLWIKNDT